jgi:Ran-binding protein 3
MNGTTENQAPSATVVPDDTTDVRSVSSDNDGERVRERLKKTTIAPSAASSGCSRPGSGADTADQDHVMSSSEDPPRRSRKRSHDESDEDKADGEDVERARRVKVHERKRSRETTEADRLRAGSGLERVKTPPTHPEEENESIIERVASPVGTLERKRSLGKLDKEEQEEDQKKKISKTEEDRRTAEESETTTTTTTKAAEETERTEENSGPKVGCSLLAQTLNVTLTMLLCAAA